VRAYRVIGRYKSLNTTIREDGLFSEFSFPKITLGRSVSVDVPLFFEQPALEAKPELVMLSLGAAPDR